MAMASEHEDSMRCPVAKMLAIENEYDLFASTEMLRDSVVGESTLSSRLNGGTHVWFSKSKTDWLMRCGTGLLVQVAVTTLPTWMGDSRHFSDVAEQFCMDAASNAPQSAWTPPRSSMTDVESQA